MLCALVDPAAAEATRRQLDAEGLLELSAKVRRHEGRIAIPLSQAALPSLERVADNDDDAGDGDGEEETVLRWLGGVLRTCRLEACETGRGPRAAVRTACARALEGCPPALIDQLLSMDDGLPRRWEKLGDVVLFAPAGMFGEGTAAARVLATLAPAARSALLAALAAAVGARRVGVQSRIDVGLHRNSRARLLWPEEGGDGWTVQRDNGISYGLDVTRTMFSSGNGTEKARVGRFACAAETVVDLYAGIGFFTLPYLVHAGAAHVHACEWDTDALAALRHNLVANGVAARCTVHAGDNARSLPAFAGTAHRVNLGLIPSSEAGWPVAVGALRAEGGTLHVHANVGASSAEERDFCARLLERLVSLGRAAGRAWAAAEGGARVTHVERVKNYAPKVRHLVVDVELGSAVQRTAEAAPAAQTVDGAEGAAEREGAAAAAAAAEVAAAAAAAAAAVPTTSRAPRRGFPNGLTPRTCA